MRANPLSIAEGQKELFRLFTALFSALTGTSVVSIKNIEHISQQMLARVQSNPNTFSQQFNETAMELEDFYKKNKSIFFEHARSLGGVKLVIGGQRAFVPATLTGVKITSLYADTQLIPDPIYPYFTGDMLLNAMHLQMAHALYYILQLKPLIDSSLPIPPVFIFPSFEMELEAGDQVTIEGINTLALQLVAPVCDGIFVSIEELFEYAHSHEDQFLNAVMAAKLFVPPGSSPFENLSANEALKRYFTQLKGIRDDETLELLRKSSSGTVVLNGIIERVRPQFHLYENGTELSAQPLLTQEVHWHYYEKCAQVTAQSLVKKKLLTEQSCHALRALQDDSLSWLANIPIDGLAELHRNQESKIFRRSLDACISQLTLAEPANLNEIVREVNHSLSSLVQEHQKSIREIENKYSLRKWSVCATGALALGTAAMAFMLPSLAPALGVTAPKIAAVSSVAGGVAGYGKEKIGEIVEKRSIRKTMLGMLAVARSKNK